MEDLQGDGYSPQVGAVCRLSAAAFQMPSHHDWRARRRGLHCKGPTGVANCSMLLA